MSLFVFTYKTMFSFACCSILEKSVKKLLRNFEYSKSQKAKKLWALRPKLLIKKCVQVHAPNKSSLITSRFRFWNCGHFGIRCTFKIWILLKSPLVKQNRNMWSREGGSWVNKLVTTVETSNGKFQLVLRSTVPTNFIIDLYIIW